MMREQYELGFAHVDYAGLMFSGDFYMWAEHAFQRWQTSKGLSWRKMIDVYNVGLPSVETRCRYVSPIMMEQPFEISLSLDDLTTRGFTYSFEFVKAEGLICAFGYSIKRFVNMETLRGWAEIPAAVFDVFQKLETSPGMEVGKQRFVEDERPRTNRSSEGRKECMNG